MMMMNTDKAEKKTEEKEVERRTTQREVETVNFNNN